MRAQNMITILGSTIVINGRDLHREDGISMVRLHGPTSMVHIRFTPTEGLKGSVNCFKKNDHLLESECVDFLEYT